MLKKSVGRKENWVFFEGQKLLYQKGEHHLRVGLDNNLKLYTVHYNSKKLTKSTFPKLNLQKLTSRKLEEIANIFFTIRQELEQKNSVRLQKNDIKKIPAYFKEAILIDIQTDEAEVLLKEHFPTDHTMIEMLNDDRKQAKAGKSLLTTWAFILEAENLPEESSLFVFYDNKKNIPEILQQVDKWGAKNYRGWTQKTKSNHLYTSDNENIEGAYKVKHEITKEWIIEQFLILLQEDKHAVAAISGIEQFARLDKIQPKNKVTLRKIGNLYFERKIKPLKEKNKKDAKSWWGEFIKIVKKVYVSDITLNDMNHYQTTIHSLRETGNLSPTWVKHRLDMVKTILKNSLKFIEDTSDVRIVLDWCQHFHYPNKTQTYPKPISQEHFHELLKYCQDNNRENWEAILLLSLNCGLYLKDIKDLKWKHLDLPNKTLTMRRVKTGILRVCCLWDRTVEVIERYKKTIKHRCDSVFVGRSGLPYKTQSSRNCFNEKIKEKTSVPKEVKYNHIRDGAITAAVRSHSPEQHIKLFSGHSCGISDSYAMRDPSMVKDVCDAIEQHYFPVEKDN